MRTRRKAEAGGAGLPTFTLPMPTRAKARVTATRSALRVRAISARYGRRGMMSALLREETENEDDARHMPQAGRQQMRICRKKVEGVT